MAGSCMSLKCSDVCKCINIHSSNGSIIIDQGGVTVDDAGNCDWDLSVNPNLSVNITATFDPITRELCILDKGVVNNCVTIPDDDDQSLELNGNILSIHKVDGTMVNSIDLTPILPLQIPFTLTSDSLVVTPGGTEGHSPNIELIPSSDVSNILILGSDGRPYVPAVSIPSQRDVDIDANDCISFTKVVTSGKITFTPLVDFDCLANEICDRCEECDLPSVFITDLQSNSFKLFITNISAGDTFDVSLDGGITFISVGQNVSPLVVAGLNENTSYQVVVRRNCVNGLNSITNIQNVITPILFICRIVGAININYSPYNFTTGKYKVTVTWTSVQGAIGYIITDPVTGTPITTFATSMIFELDPSQTYQGTIQTICGTGGNSALTPYTITTPLQASCPAPTNLVANII